jgi:uncharacterized protein (TIGR02145 family)
MEGLAAGTRYYARTYATNSKGTTYNSADVVFKTHNLPSVTTTEVTNITGTGASSGGNVTDDGEVNVTARGVCWSTTTGPTVALTTKTTNGSGKGIFSSTITGLSSGTPYFIRAYATNQYGTSYGAEIPFTAAKAPLATTNPATLIGMTVATLNGTVNANGSSTTVTFEYGLTTSYGTTITATPGTVTGSTDANLLANITGLNPGTTYHFRVVAVNSGGQATGNDQTFVTIQVPGTSTQAATNITTVSATLNGIVNANNSSTIVTFEYGTTTAYGSSVAATPSPVTGNSDTPVSASITSLTPGTTYHFRVRALSDGGEVFGSDQVFTTLKLPDANALAATNITGTTATLNGTVNANNSQATVTFEYGLTTSYGSTATASPDQVTGSIATSVTASLSGLTQSTEYHYRVKAVSAAGTSFSGDLTFITSATPPTVTTGTATSVTTTTATLAGTVNANNHSTTVTFEYGLTTSYGTEVTAVESPVNGTSSTSVSKGITGLNPSTTYHYRVKAVNAGGTVYGSDQTFFTALTPPTATTGSATSNTSSTATLQGTVNANGNSTTVTFEYGLTTSYGAEVTAVQSPVTGTGSTSVSAGITGLNAAATYHYRVKAVSAGGTSYGGDLTFNTLGTVTDYDGNLYNTVRIGTQVWMSENLKTTKYRDGTVIPNITTSEWGSLTNGAYRWLDNNIANKNIYGALYNSFTVVDNRNLCPAGWHVPTLAEFNTLFTYLGGESVAGGKLKEAGTTHWVTPNTGATNESGFTGLPGSSCGSSFFPAAGYSAGFYTTTWYNQAGSTYWRGLMYDNSGISSGMSTYNGYSVRCIQGEGIVLPAVTTTAVTNIGATTATSGGNVASTGGSAITARGVCWSTTQNPIVTGSHTDDGSATGAFTSSITGLTAGTTYYLRAYATNGVGTAYGNEISFTTPNPPTTTTGAATSITSSTATLGGTVNANGYSTVVTFEYGLTTAYGSEVTAAQSPVTGTGATTVSAGITGLSASTTYHFRVKGVSTEGTSTGNDATFTTASGSVTVTDADGNEYNVITIGTQKWIQPDLQTTKYSNGDPITQAIGNSAWAALTTGGYSWYDNDISNKGVYGALYNWWAVIDIRNICPVGWHSASKQDWADLTVFLGGYVAGKLKETGTLHWSMDDPGATNESGFTAVPGGVRNSDGSFATRGTAYQTWTSTIFDGSRGWYTGMSGLLGLGFSAVYFQYGLSLRCVQGAIPLVLTNPFSKIGSTFVNLNGKVNPNGASTTVTFEYGTTTSYGSSVLAIQNPILGTTPVNVSVGLTSLTPGTTYHYRVKAVNSGGTSYGSDMTFVTPAQVSDVVGNAYNAVIIGTQTWMQENLKTTKYNDYISIPLVTNAGEWSGLSYPGYCYYNNDITTYNAAYGALYNWYAVNSAKLCPSGWHVPSDTEWTTLADYLGGKSIAGGKLKDATTTHWIGPNTGATNETGFTALPGGYRTTGGSFDYIGSIGFWWSATENSFSLSLFCNLFNIDSQIFTDTYSKVGGFSVRCLKD